MDVNFRKPAAQYFDPESKPFMVWWLNSKNAMPLINFHTCNFHKSHSFAKTGRYEHFWIYSTTEENVYYGHLRTFKKCPDYQGVLIFQVSLYDKASFGTITKCQVCIFLSTLINRFHYTLLFPEIQPESQCVGTKGQVSPDTRIRFS